ncbi:phosphate transporter PHO1 isoform X1 [Juglans regia]|uniref:Phosphate transporter PHO1 isoform X1 n=2 Tax=Juglans regia TaxID=51240 RepID=A0A6P9EZ56_JUGRE|nr:phosphate transporter PHO1 isoform X1 [Juglans regia]
MVKFSKELEGQLIPEWRDAYLSYRELKRHIKKIKLSRLPKHPRQDMNGDYGLSIFDPVRFVAWKICDKFRNSDSKTDVIQIGRSKSMEDGEDQEVYETDLSQLFSQEDEVKLHVRIFFEKLDEEHNKINQFYKERESEVVEKAEILNKQLQILVDYKQVLSHLRLQKNSPSSPNFGSSPPSWSSVSPPRSSNYSESSIELAENLSHDQMYSETEEVIAALDQRNSSTRNYSGTKTKLTKQGKPKMGVKIDIPAETPTRAIAALTSSLWEDLVKISPKKEYCRTGDQLINRKKVQSAEKMIRGAYVELYRVLGLLKAYSSMNMMAFTKILKKFDKVSNQHASANYLQAVKASPFISSDKVVKLMDEVESIFIKHFASNDRKKAMKFLRPQQKKASHMITFFVGLFTGCFVSLFTIYAILAHLSRMFSPPTEIAYMDGVYPVFSVFALLSLHLFMYGCNLFMWKSKRINYNFIFGFSPNTSLKYRDAFLICTTLMTIVVGAMVVHLLLRASGVSPGQVDAIPAILLLFSLALLICPLDIFYRTTRYCFIRVIRNIFFSPFYKVVLVDFFMADQLTSQIPLLRQMESAACYFLEGNFRTHHYETCRNGRLFKDLSYVISFMPYYWRAMQCARRWFDSNDVDHLANMGKYVSAMVAAGARLTYDHKNHDHHSIWFPVVIVTSVVATVYQCYWDFVKDWGLLKQNSKNLWLRDDLILKNKNIYYVSIALNVVLRVAWVESVLKLNVNDVQQRLLDFVLASLEVIRRGHWNFYRLENEHLNNVGNYRAVKEVPLPFHEMDSDG